MLPDTVSKIAWVASFCNFFEKYLIRGSLNTFFNSQKITPAWFLIPNPPLLLNYCWAKNLMKAIYTGHLFYSTLHIKMCVCYRLFLALWFSVFVNTPLIFFHRCFKRFWIVLNFGRQMSPYFHDNSNILNTFRDLHRLVIIPEYPNNEM